MNSDFKFHYWLLYIVMCAQFLVVGFHLVDIETRLHDEHQEIIQMMEEFSDEIF